MNKKMSKQIHRILLANSPNDLQEQKEDWEYSIAHACLAASLIKAGHQVEIIHFIKQDWDSVEATLRQKLFEFQPNIFGISILSDCRINAHSICAIVKSFNVNIHVVAGGVHASFLWGQVLQDENIDTIVIGEGEETLLELIETIDKQKDWPSKEYGHIKGLAWRGALDCYKNPPRPRNFKLDELPIPRHDLYADLIKEKGIGYMVTGRGCSNHPGCTFCCGQAYWQGCIAQRKAHTIFKEIQFLFKINPNLREIHFLDDEFLCNRKRVYELFDMVDKAKLKFKWICSGRASSLDDNLIKYIKKHGCYNVHIGVETFSQSILNNANKRIDVKQMQEAIKLCRKHKLTPTLMCIVGLPGENAQTVRESIEGAKAIGEAIEPCILLIYPGTKVYELAKEKGLLTDDYWASDKMAPLYTAEHSKARLMWWAYKIAIITHWHAGTLNKFIGRKFRLNRITMIFNKFMGTKSR